MKMLSKIAMGLDAYVIFTCEYGSQFMKHSTHHRYKTIIKPWQN